MTALFLGGLAISAAAAVLVGPAVEPATAQSVSTHMAAAQPVPVAKPPSSGTVHE